MQPFNYGYLWFNTSENEVIPDPSISKQNSYIGGVLQQATSVVTDTDPNCYEGETGCYSIYGFEYAPGFDDAVSRLRLLSYAKAGELTQMCARAGSTLRGYRITRLRGR